jgi:hypothetical protein
MVGADKSALGIEDFDIHHIVRALHAKLVSGVLLDEFNGEMNGMRLLVCDSANRVCACQEFLPLVTIADAADRGTDHPCPTA